MAEGEKASLSGYRVERDADGRPIWSYTNAEGEKVKLRGLSFRRPPCPYPENLFDEGDEAGNTENQPPQSGTDVSRR